jgi:hypothetical protein
MGADMGGNVPDHGLDRFRGQRTDGIDHRDFFCAGLESQAVNILQECLVRTGGIDGKEIYPHVVVPGVRHGIFTRSFTPSQ